MTYRCPECQLEGITERHAVRRNHSSETARFHVVVADGVSIDCGPMVEETHLHTSFPSTKPSPDLLRAEVARALRHTFPERAALYLEAIDDLWTAVTRSEEAIKLLRVMEGHPSVAARTTLVEAIRVLRFGKAPGGAAMAAETAHADRCLCGHRRTLHGSAASDRCYGTVRAPAGDRHRCSCRTFSPHPFIEGSNP